MPPISVAGIATSANGRVPGAEPELRLQGHGERAVTIASEAAVSISEALEEAGIKIPFPQHDLHVRTMDASVAGP